MFYLCLNKTAKTAEENKTRNYALHFGKALMSLLLVSLSGLIFTVFFCNISIFVLFCHHHIHEFYKTTFLKEVICHLGVLSSYSAVTFHNTQKVARSRPLTPLEFSHREVLVLYFHRGRNSVVIKFTSNSTSNKGVGNFPC